MGPVEIFEQKLAEFTGSPYVVSTDCCTHAIELCMRLLEIRSCSFSAYTYISVPMTMKLLGINYSMTNDAWKDQYQFTDTPVWDSARCLRPNMYKAGMYQCLSFGPGKPLNNVRGGAILLDNEDHFRQLKMMSYDGRDPSCENWKDQKLFEQGFHYMMRYEECENAISLLAKYINTGLFDHSYKPYTDLRNIKIK